MQAGEENLGRVDKSYSYSYRVFVNQMPVDDGADRINGLFKTKNNCIGYILDALETKGYTGR